MNGAVGSVLISPQTILTVRSGSGNGGTDEDSGRDLLDCPPSEQPLHPSASVRATEYAEEVAPTRCSLLSCWLDMRHSCRVLVAILVLAGLLPTAFGRTNIVCLEASGRVSFGCNDIVPDEVAVRLAVRIPILGFGSEACGFCHGFAIGQAVTHSNQDLVHAVGMITAPYHLALSQPTSMIQHQSFPVPILDSSGSSSPLKC